MGFPLHRPRRLRQSDVWRRMVQETRLTIRVVDRKADKEVWLGTMTSSIAPGASANDVAGVVAQTLNDFPARRP